MDSFRRVLWMLLVGAVIVSGCAVSEPAAKLTSEMVAPTPPMGWNSFDAYDSAINEKQYRDTVDYMAEHLLQYNWEYAVIDYIWWHPEPGNWDHPKRFGHPDIRYEKDGKPIDVMHMDQYGRLIPAPERFPSSKNGKGFKPLADYVHSKGMKFGIHIMRGIHRQAVYENTPILGTQYRARDIVETWDICNWCNHMYGVDASKPGAQEYYNSLFNLYAEWEVDYIKADDMMYPPYHKGEIEMMRKAIDQCGRPMVLSLSCGEAPLSQAKHLQENANLWRISSDFWDNWKSLRHNFDLLNAWSSYIQPNHWPDADMLPIGHISLNGRPHGPDRMSQLTWNEHYTLMTLWCIARSPLMMGGDLLTSSEQSLSFLKNPEVLAVNQNSTDNRQVFMSKEKFEDEHENRACWIATDPDTGDKYVALFNLTEDNLPVTFNFELENLRGRYAVRDLWQRKNIGIYENKLTAVIAPHGAKLYRLTETTDKPDVFRYQNPISSGIDPKGLRDCHVFRDNGRWYMVGTSYPHWPREGGVNPGVRLYGSDDLLNWKDEGLLIDRSQLDPSVWYLDRFWAPEVQKVAGKYYLLVNCRNESDEYKHGHGPCVAVADTLKGPYTVLTEKGPFWGGNDLTFFEDDDGVVYAYWNGSKRMYAAKVDMETMKPILPEGSNEPTIIFRTTPGTWDAIGIEGPYVIKHNDKYYLFYSSWSRGYEIGYAMAKNPLGPWVKFEGNPIYGATSQDICKKNNLPYEGDPKCPFRAVGHNEIFIGPDGRYWLSCHGIIPGKPPMLVIDPIDFLADWTVQANGPTYTPQEVTLPGNWRQLIELGDLTLGLKQTD